MLDIKRIDSLPIDPLIINNAQDSLETLRTYQDQLNLVFEVDRAGTRYLDLQDFILRSIPSAKPIRLLGLVIESHIISLLTTNTIIDNRLRNLRPHYAMRLRYGLSKDLPTPEYNRLLNLGRQRVWGAEYGTMAYSLHLTNTIEHYLNTSEIEDISSNYLATRSNVGTWAPVITSLINVRRSPRVQHHLSIYDIPIDLIKNLPDVRQVRTLLVNMRALMNTLLPWYEDDIRIDDTNRHLVDLARACHRYQLTVKDFISIENRFIHMEDCRIALLYPHILRARRSIDSIVGTGVVQALNKLLIEGIRPDLDDGLIDNLIASMLNDLYPPGGYNLLLISVAATLLNRALSRLVSLGPSIDIELDERTSSLVTDLYDEVLGLLAMAGLTLYRSNIQEVEIMGLNLITISGKTVMPTKELEDV